jgi:hypothetical protein
MSDTPTPPAAPAPAPAPAGGFTQADVDRIVGERLAREAKKFADYEDVKAKAEKFDALDASTKSDLEKANEKATAAEARAAEAEARAMRLEVATEKGLTPAQAKRLSGSTREDLEKDADELLETFGGNASGGTPPPARRPAELRGGNDPSTQATEEETDPAKLAASVPRGY